MSVRRVVLSSLMVSALALVACVVADDFSDGAVLGPAEPIGKLLVVKAVFDDELSPASPVPLPPNELTVFASPAEALAHEHCAVPAQGALWRQTAISTPGDEIPYHLTQAFLRLTAAGLTDEAKQVGTLLQDFQTKHAARLLLATKQAQLNELQAEIERLKLQVEKGITSEQVVVSMKVFAVSNKEVCRRLMGPQAIATPTGAEVNRLPRRLEPQEHRELMEWLKECQGVEILSKPQVTTMSGSTGVVSIGQVHPLPGVAQAGGPAHRQTGTTVSLTPTITEKDEVRLAAQIEVSELDELNSVTLNDMLVPGVTNRKFQTTCDIKHGQTLVLSSRLNALPPGDQPFKEIFVLATVEIVPVYDETASPLVLPVHVIPQPTAVPLVK